MKIIPLIAATLFLTQASAFAGMCRVNTSLVWKPGMRDSMVLGDDMPFKLSGKRTVVEKLPASSGGGFSRTVVEFGDVHIAQEIRQLDVEKNIIIKPFRFETQISAPVQKKNTWVQTYSFELEYFDVFQGKMIIKKGGATAAISASGVLPYVDAFLKHTDPKSVRGGDPVGGLVFCDIPTGQDMVGGDLGDRPRIDDVAR